MTRPSQPFECMHGYSEIECAERTCLVTPALPLHRVAANVGVICSTCDGGGCLDCTDPA